MTGRLLVAVLLALATALVAPAPAYACSCVAKTDAEYAGRADVVFTGFIANNEVDRKNKLRTVTFRVDRVFKGDAFLTQVVTMDWDQNSCGIEFVGVDPPYAVFARQAVAGLTADVCGGTVSGSIPAGLGDGRSPLPDPPATEADGAASWRPLAGGLLALAAAAVLDIAMRRRAR